MQIDEYNLTKESTLVPIHEDELNQEEIRWFRAELKAIAGLNPYGGQILELRWGPTWRDPMSTADTIKYLDFVHNGVELGERRHFIEIWRSPEFLERSGRYQIVTRQDEDGEKLLKELPPHGCYDYFLRLETRNLTYHPLDREALEVCQLLWQYEQVPQNQRDAMERADAERERRWLINHQRQQSSRVQFGVFPAHLIN